ncbi:uro-adherence factor A isoform X2 [Parasteatoda tepidariorum]|nr:uncharacterized protein LOC107441233 isoform X2 [Parasteatoda tepidariorum]
MAVLESLQERLMLAIEDVNHHLASPSGAESQTRSKTAGQSRLQKSVSDSTGSEKKLRFAGNADSTHSKSENYGLKTELSKSDSLNKDSGIGASDSSLSTTDHAAIRNEEEDELLQLLDLIDQKSLVLLKEVENASSLDHNKPTSQMGDGSSARLLDNLLFEKVDTQRQLSQVKAERDDLSRRLAKLELATEAVTKQKIKVQQQLNVTLLENQSLQQRIQSSDVKSKAESLGYLADIERSNIRRKYLQYSEKSRKKVSSILKEGNVLELQKQLLTYVMENDVLRAKLQQDDSSKSATWLKIESQLRKDLKEANEENQRLQELMQSKDLEIASLKDKIRCLEEGSEADSCVRNFGMASTEDWREPGIQNAYNKRSNLNAISPFSPLGYGDFSKTQSLPAMQLDARAKLKEQEASRNNYCHAYDTSSFTEVPLDHSFQSSHPNDPPSHTSVKKSDLVDLTNPAEPNFSSTSTLVQSPYMYQPSLQSGLSAPNLSGLCKHETFQNWGFSTRKSSAPEATKNNGGSRLVNGHLCWKGANRLSTSQDISSICTEFDPLTEDTPSCENFVDSLNLSIPLKPTPAAIPQLSSIGDSLHSASLEMGCSSSPVMYQDTPRKILNARSVDGIRDLLVDNVYCKRPHSSQYGRTSVAPALFSKQARRLPVNIMNCMHETSDYSLM